MAKKTLPKLFNPAMLDGETNVERLDSRHKYRVTLPDGRSLHYSLIVSSSYTVRVEVAAYFTDGEFATRLVVADMKNFGDAVVKGFFNALASKVFEQDNTRSAEASRVFKDFV